MKKLGLLLVYKNLPSHEPAMQVANDLLNYFYHKGNADNVHVKEVFEKLVPEGARNDSYGNYPVTTFPTLFFLEINEQDNTKKVLGKLEGSAIETNAAQMMADQFVNLIALNAATSPLAVVDGVPLNSKSTGLKNNDKAALIGKVSKYFIYGIGILVLAVILKFAIGFFKVKTVHK